MAPNIHETEKSYHPAEKNRAYRGVNRMLDVEGRLYNHLLLRIGNEEVKISPNGFEAKIPVNLVGRLSIETPERDIIIAGDVLPNGLKLENRVEKRYDISSKVKGNVAIIKFKDRYAKKAEVPEKPKGPSPESTQKLNGYVNRIKGYLNSLGEKVIKAHQDPSMIQALRLR